jgi:FkbM family methyltransferase
MKKLIKKLFPDTVFWLQTRLTYWEDYIWKGEWELRELHRYVPRDKIAVDVGGNIGEYTYHLGRLAAEVVTFEPNPIYHFRLKKLQLRNMRLETTALSAQAGSAALRIPNVNGRPASGMGSLEAGAVSESELYSICEVETRTLDSYGLKNVGFIKIDVEGHEEKVLDGAMLTITRDRPNLLIEIEERHNPKGLERIVERFAALGYQTYFFQDHQRRTIREFSPAKHQGDISREELALTNRTRREIGYINNFLFVHEN